MFNKIPIKIHCWGGLGSQLYAWALFERLNILFPGRPLMLVLHTSGVTRRVSNLNALFSKEELATQDDYGNSQDFVNANIIGIAMKFGILNTRKFKSTLLLKKLAYRLGFITSCENEKNVAQLKPWVFSIRGHYSNLVIEPEIINAMLSRANRNNFSHLDMNSTERVGFALHYRLGDLLTLSEKSPIEARKVASCITKLDSRNVVVISDSPEVALKLLGELVSNVNFKNLDLPIWDAIKFLTLAQVFIGTPSKISEWVAIFRVHFASKNGITILPIEMKSQMNQVLPVELKNRHLSYY